MRICKIYNSFIFEEVKIIVVEKRSMGSLIHKEIILSKSLSEWHFHLTQGIFIQRIGHRAYDMVGVAKQCNTFDHLKVR